MKKKESLNLNQFFVFKIIKSVLKQMNLIEVNIVKEIEREGRMFPFKCGLLLEKYVK